MPKIDEDLPLVAFEVICSVAQKEIGRDIANLVTSKPCLAIFVLIRNKIKKHSIGDSTPEQWLRRIEKYAEKFRDNYNGIVRTAVWYEEDVDKLHSML